jgi:hypothetical protein
VQTGIWKPAGLAAALTIRTTFTPPNQPPPYVDDVGDEVLVRYKYRGTDPNLSDNRALRAAMIQGLPLAYVVGVARGVYSNTSFEGKLASGYNLSTAPVRFVTGELGWICAWSGVAGAYSLWRTTDGGSVWQSVSIPGV